MLLLSRRKQMVNYSDVTLQNEYCISGVDDPGDILNCPQRRHITFGTGSPVTIIHSTTRDDGRFSLRYPISSLLEPGQLVSSSSSSCLSWMRLERPLLVSWVQPERRENTIEFLLKQIRHASRISLLS